jgi:glyoxylase-like metal-dependent hydrolase (beta-lactamase superfamily II)
MGVSIPFVREVDPAYGQAIQVSPLIRRVTANNPGPFTFLGTGTYIVGAPEPGADVAVIDPGPDDTAHLEALLAALDGQRVTTIAITHSHLDHSPLARPVQARTGGVIYGLAAAEAHAPLDGPALDDDDDLVFRPDVTVSDGQRLSGRGWALEALLTPGHASNHVCYALPEENALFSGDHVMGWSTTVVSPPDGDMTAYYASLDRIIGRDFSTLWPTHGPPITEPKPFLEAYRAHRLDRERQILAQLGAGRSRIREMVPEMYAAVDKRLHPAAARSVLAHLIHMTRTGAVTTEGPPGPDSDYRLAG